MTGIKSRHRYLVTNADQVAQVHLDLADHPVESTTSPALVNGGIHSFVQAAALEMKDGIRINVVSSGLVEDAVHLSQHGDTDRLRPGQIGLGGDGDDAIDGGTGSDTLSGGSGADASINFSTIYLCAASLAVVAMPETCTASPTWSCRICSAEMGVVKWIIVLPKNYIIV